MPRRSPRKSTRYRRRSSRTRGTMFPLLALFIVAILAMIISLLSRVPIQVWLFLTAFLVIGVAVFLWNRIYQHQSRLRREEQQALQRQEEREHERQMQALRVQQERLRIGRGGMGAIHELKPEGFELLVADLMKWRGFQSVERTGKSGDRGIDITARDVFGNLVIVQCKKYTVGRNVPGPDILRFLGSVSDSQAQKGLFVTTTGFTSQARDYAERNPTIELVDGQTLLIWMQSSPYYNDQDGQIRIPQQ